MHNPQAVNAKFSSPPLLQPEAHFIGSGLFRGDLLFDRVHDIVFFFKDTQGRYTAVNAGQYVIRARIGLACSRLQHSHDPISDIALTCGYADQASFTRQFRKSVGLAPSAYREMRA